MGLSVTPQDVRLGKTFSRDGKTVENGELNLTNLQPENIKSGVNIGGIVGNMSSLESGRIIFRDYNTQTSEYELTYTLPSDIKFILVVITSGKADYFHDPLCEFFRVKNPKIKYNLMFDTKPWIEVNGRKYTAGYNSNHSYGGNSAIVIYGWK